MIKKIIKHRSAERNAAGICLYYNNHLRGEEINSPPEMRLYPLEHIFGRVDPYNKLMANGAQLN